MAAPAGLAFGIGWKLLTDTPAETSTLIGLAFGAICGAVAASKFKEETVTLAAPDAAAKTDQIHNRLVELGFQLGAQTPTYRLYETVAQGSFNIGAVGIPGLKRRVRLKIQQGTIIVVAPSDVIAALG